jgi:hypothetical protein
VNNQPKTADSGWSSSFGVGRGANNLHHENKHVTNDSYELHTRTDSLDKGSKCHVDMRFGTWNVKSL